MRRALGVWRGEARCEMRRCETTSSAVLVTVGTTRFDALVSSVLSDDCRSALFDACGFSRLVVQHGECGSETAARVASVVAADARVTAFAYDAEMARHVAACSLVIGHAGAGTTLDALRASKPLISVPNTALLGNHQEELAEALAAAEHAVRCRPDQLAGVVRAGAWRKLVPLPESRADRLADVLDEMMQEDDESRHAAAGSGLCSVQ